jgi:secreted trypsin-like serine protease
VDRADRRHQNSVGGVLASIICLLITPVAKAQTEVDQDRPSLSKALPYDLPPLIVSKASASKSDIPKIIGGRDATPGQFKWQVAILRSDASKNDSFSGFFCGGTLVDMRWILTAAHCTYRRNSQQPSRPPVRTEAADIDAYVGSHDFNDGMRYQIQRIVRHEKYDPETMEHDLALLELRAPAVLGRNVALLRTAVPADSTLWAVGGKAVAIGWGSTDRGTIPPNLRKPVQTLKYTTVQLKSARECNAYYLGDRRIKTAKLLKDRGETDVSIRRLLDKWYPADAQLITDSMVCAGSNDGSQDACFGDSGGPLVVPGRQDLQIGVISWGPNDGCGLTNLFGVYVLLARYESWIGVQIKETVR